MSIRIWPDSRAIALGGGEEVQEEAVAPARALDFAAA